MSLFSILDHSSRALRAASAGVSVASNNVANASTPGYARETLALQAKGSLQSRGLLLGQGVAAESVLSAYDRHSQAQVLGRLGADAWARGRAIAFESIETSFADDGGNGLGSAIDGLFDAFSLLEASPEEPSARQAVLAAGSVLSQLVRQAASDLADRQQAADSQVGTLVEQANSLASEVAALNARIVELEAGGQDAHDLRARRTAVLEELSAIGPVAANERPDGSATVLFAGQALTTGGTARALSTALDASTGLLRVHIQMGASSADVTASIGSGSLGAALDVRDQVVPGLLGQLDELAYAIATEVNAVHQSGFGLDGVTGRAFFSAPATVSGAASAMAVDAAVATDPSAVAAASSAAGVPGDGSCATALAALSFGLLMSSGGATFAQYWSGVVSAAGHDASSAYASADRAALELGAARDVRDSLSSVSLEEEALDLLRFQDAYKAAAKVMQIANEMLDELLNLVG